MAENKSGWYLVYTKPRQERIAYENLCRQGYKVYLPRFEKKTKAGARVYALFPRYLFIRLTDHVDNWRPIRSTIGVSRTIKFGGKAISVPDDLIDALRARENQAGLQPMREKPLQRGDRVIFKDGALRDYEAIFHHAAGHDRVVVLMKILGEQTPMTVSAKEIEARE